MLTILFGFIALRTTNITSTSSALFKCSSTESCPCGKTRWTRMEVNSELNCRDRLLLRKSRLLGPDSSLTCSQVQCPTSKKESPVLDLSRDTRISNSQTSELNYGSLSRTIRVKPLKASNRTYPMSSRRWASTQLLSSWTETTSDQSSMIIIMIWRKLTYIYNLYSYMHK